MSTFTRQEIETALRLVRAGQVEFDREIQSWMVDGQEASFTNTDVLDDLKRQGLIGLGSARRGVQPVHVGRTTIAEVLR